MRTQHSSDGKVTSGWFLDKGRRPNMEDRVDVRFYDDKVLGESVGWFGCYDGHGGDGCVNFVTQHLFKAVTNNPKFCMDVHSALTHGFVETDQNYMRSDAGRMRDDGCTGALALLIGNRLLLAHCGDCRIVLSRAGKAKQLTSDHKPNRDDERERIEKAGGVVAFVGTWRVGGVLAVSRAFGDRNLKKYVVAIPELSEESLGPTDDFIVMASDGIWDVLSNQEAVDLVRDITDPKAAAKKVIEEALERGTNDNVSCVVTRFHFA